MRRLITYKELQPKKGVPYTRQHLRRKIKDGTWPAPVQLGDNAIAWFEDEIDEHLRNLPRAVSASATADKHQSPR
jgi:predicted DNA-binding transcriptional regulator AlpA